MATLDPYTQPLPSKITDGNGNPSEEFRRWLIYDNRWKFDSWIRSGGGTDAIEETTQEFIYLQSLASVKAQLQDSEKRLSELENLVSGFASLNASLAKALKDVCENRQELDMTTSLAFSNTALISDQQKTIDNILQVI